MPDLTIVPANVVWTSGPKATGNAGVVITAGQVLYVDPVSGLYKLAQCDTTPEEAAAVGIALNGAAVNQPITVALDTAVINIGAAVTSKATTYVVSAAAGAIAPQADLVTGNRITEVGYATSAAGAFVVEISNRNITV